MFRDEHGDRKSGRQCIADAFNKQFTSNFSDFSSTMGQANAARNLNADLCILEVQSHCAKLDGPSVTFTIHKFKYSDVIKAIRSLKNKHCTGKDGISALIYSIEDQALMSVVLYLFNTILNEGKILASWKTAIIKLLHKKGDHAKITDLLAT